MSREEALALVKPERGLDLIEIAPTAKPPVARLMSYDKYRYAQEKAEKKERRAIKSTGIKRIQISPRAAEHDLEVKVRQLEEFLNHGHQVEIYLRLRGRERYNKEWINQKLDDFLKKITVAYKVVSAPKFGAGLSIQITKK